MSTLSLTEVAALQARLRELEAESSGLVRRLRTAPEAELQGAHLVLEAGGRDVLLAVATVEEVVRVVALQPVAGAAPAVAGAFSCRGRSLFAIELAAVLQSRAALPAQLDAHLVLLNLAAPIALVVNRVKAVVSGVTLVDERRGGGGDVEVERRAPKLGDLVARVSGTVMPLLDPSLLSAVSLRDTYLPLPTGEGRGGVTQ